MTQHTEAARRVQESEAALQKALDEQAVWDGKVRREGGAQAVWEGMGRGVPK